MCADRKGDPYCVLHAHHIIPRAQFGSDDLDNLITLCDLCHAVVTPRWHKPWFPDGMRANPADIESMRAEYEEFLRLPPEARRERQALLWTALGVS